MSTYRAREDSAPRDSEQPLEDAAGCGGAGRSEKIRVDSPLACEDGWGARSAVLSKTSVASRSREGGAGMRCSVPKAQEP